MWSGSVWKLMQPPCCQPVFLHDWPAGRLPIFFPPSHPVTPLSPSSSCSTSPHFLLSLSVLAACLHFNPTPHLSPSLSRPGDRRGGFFFVSFRAPTWCQGYQGWRRDWRRKSWLGSSLLGRGICCGWAGENRPLLVFPYESEKLHHCSPRPFFWHIFQKYVWFNTRLVALSTDLIPHWSEKRPRQSDGLLGWCAVIWPPDKPTPRRSDYKHCLFLSQRAARRGCQLFSLQFSQL